MTVRVAVPAYVGGNFDEAPPGHRFRLYFGGWTEAWALVAQERDRALASASELRPATLNGLRGLASRQDALAAIAGERMLSLDYLTDGPFVTGMGMEHPLENGFAFMDPYGLPYLPGSSLKGVLRRAAEELALFADDPCGWSVPAVWWLFGFDQHSAYLCRDERNDSAAVRAERGKWRAAYRERLDGATIALAEGFLRLSSAPAVLECSRTRDVREALERLPQSDALGDMHSAGALEFWDAYLDPAGGRLRIDIMNPHFGRYYEGRGLPSDDDNPNPIFFLAVPPASKVRLHVRLRTSPLLPESLATAWRGLVEAACDYAGDWLGFGAKTAIGYGRLRRDQKAEAEREAQRVKAAAEARKAREEVARCAAEEARQARLATMSEIDRAIEDLRDCDVTRIDAIYRNELPKLSDEDQKQLAAPLIDAYKRAGKWTGKLSDKQQAKKHRLLQILGRV